MIRNVVKFAFFVVIICFSITIAVKLTSSYVAEINTEQKTISDALMQNKLQEELKKAEEKAKAELEENNAVIITEAVTTKPITTAEITETEVTITELAVTTPEITEVEVTITDVPTAAEPVTEFKRGGLLPTDRTNIPLKSFLTLTEKESEIVGDFLIEHYFLDGYTYATKETDPVLKEKKQLAADMETGVIDTFNIVVNSLNLSDITALADTDYGKLIDEVEKIKSDFIANYNQSGDFGQNFQTMYDGSINYFDRLITALQKFESTAAEFNSASNPLLAIVIITSAIDNTLIPEITAVLESSFDLVEASQEIFLEGTTGVWLLTRDEVSDIISNPNLVLYTNANS